MNPDALLKQLESDGIEHLWTIYHDFSGRACGKTVPKERFAAVAERGVVFARANLNFTVEDHQAEGTTAFRGEAPDQMAYGASKGALVSLSRTSSMPATNPRPRTSPTRGWSANLRSPS